MRVPSSLRMRWPRDCETDTCSHPTRASGKHPFLRCFSPPTDRPAQDDDYSAFYDVEPGPTLGVAIMSWLLGTAGAIVTLVLLRRATTDQHGPFSKYMYRAAGGANAGAPPQAGATPAVGTV
ncbi:unnamed protein product [Hapterophycus canaliculatus]